MSIITCLAILSLFVAAEPVHGQGVPLAQLLPDLILRDITLQSPPLPPGVLGAPEGFTHEAHFSPIEAHELNNPVVGIVASFNGQMATEFSTFPLGSSTGGFTYVFDESVGTFRRGSNSFGPLFAERALTIGRGKASVGFNYQHTSYNTFEGQDLENGSIKFYLRHEDCCTVALTPGIDPGFSLTNVPNGTRLNTPFEGDLIEAALSLRATTNTTALFVNYGVTDRWDVGVAVPFVNVSLDASVTARILRLVTATNPTVHTFDLNNTDATLTVKRSGRATGIGDIVVRTKYRFSAVAGGGLSAAVDLRAPTGDKDNLLGSGGTEAKFLLVASDQRGRVGHHLNVGYTAASGSVAGTLAGLASPPLPDEINYSGGAEFVVSPRLTVMGDFIGRTLRGAGRLDLISKEFKYSSPQGTTPNCENSGFSCSSVFFDEFEPQPGNLTLLLGTGGAKFNLRGNILITGSVLFPLTDAGLRSRMTTVVGLDVAF